MELEKSALLFRLVGRTVCERDKINLKLRSLFVTLDQGCGIEDASDLWTYIAHRMFPRFLSISPYVSGYLGSDRAELDDCDQAVKPINPSEVSDSVSSESTCCPPRSHNSRAIALRSGRTHSAPFPWATRSIAARTDAASTSPA